MRNIFIIHGVGGHPKENWFPWLKEELESLRYKVFIPQFPTPENQTLENWLKGLEEYKEHINSDTIFIGHSLGVPFVLNVCEQYRLKAAFLVAGFAGKANNEFDESMKTFTQRDFNWEKIKQHCPYFKIYHSDNDPYLSLDKAQRLADGLNKKITLIKGAGHFNESAGYKEFKLLLEDIKFFLKAVF